MLQLVSPCRSKSGTPLWEIGQIHDARLTPRGVNQSQLLTRDEMTADKIVDLRDKFRDAVTGWLEIEEAA